MKPLTGIFGSKDVLIIGSGPSVADYDLNRLQGKIKSIAVNNEIGHWPWADFGLFTDKMDDEFKRLTNLDTFKGYLITKEASGYTDDRTYVVKVKSDSVGLDFEGGVCCPINSGIVALNCALLMTTGNIYLVGFDLKSRDGHCYHDKRTNFHGKSQDALIYNTTAVKGIVSKFRMFGGYAGRVFDFSGGLLSDVFTPVGQKEFERLCK